MFSTTKDNCISLSLEAVDRKKAKGKGRGKGKGKGKGPGRWLRGRVKGSGKDRAKPSVPPGVSENSANRNVRRRLMYDDENKNMEVDDDAFMEEPAPDQPMESSVDDSEAPAEADPPGESVESSVGDSQATAEADPPVSVEPSDSQAPAEADPPVESVEPCVEAHPAASSSVDGHDIAAHAAEADVPENEADPPADAAAADAAEPAAIQDERQNPRGPTVNKNPEELADIAPPCCTLHLNCTSTCLLCS